MNLLNGLLIVAAIVFSIYRQMRPQPVGGRNAMLPVLMVAYALYTAYLSAHPTGLLDPRHVAVSLGLLVFGLLVETGLGVLRGLTVDTWREHDGTVWRRGTARTLALWGVMVVVRIGTGVLGGYLLHVTEPISAILLGVGATLIAQNVVVGMRAARLEPMVRANVA